MTNYRKESFRTAYQNFQIASLVTPENLKAFRVEYGEEYIEELIQLVENCSPNNNKIIFTGHRGSGKSTLLGQFALDMKDDFFVVFFSIANLIELSDVNHINILFATAVKLMETAEQQNVKISKTAKEAFYRWFSEHTRIESSEIAVKGDVNTGGTAGDIPWFIKFFAKITATLQANKFIRDQIKTEFAQKISDLVNRVDDIASNIKAATGKEILVIIDDLDKLDLEVVDKVYRTNISALFQPQFRMIYTIPMAATREVNLLGVIRNATNNRILSVWATKFFSREETNNPDATPNPEAIQLFKEILFRRIQPQLVDEDIIESMILKSGGTLAELMRLGSRCCERCLILIRRTPEDQELTITSDILERAITDLRIDFEQPLTSNDYQLLKEIDDNHLPTDDDNQRFLDLLHNLYILEYKNAKLWFNLHPIVKEILQRRENYQ
ncbi:MAG: P-loop NTPase fold protein [Microcystaceae cyanobacterium]